MHINGQLVDNLNSAFVEIEEGGNKPRKDKATVILFNDSSTYDHWVKYYENNTEFSYYCSDGDGNWLKMNEAKIISIDADNKEDKTTFVVEGIFNYEQQR